MCGGPADRKCCAPSGTFSVPLPHFILQTILLVLIILANTLVISVTTFDRELHTIPNIGISSLALADLLLAMVAIDKLNKGSFAQIKAIATSFRHVPDMQGIFVSGYKYVCCFVKDWLGRSVHQGRYSWVDLIDHHTP